MGQTGASLEGGCGGLEWDTPQPSRTRQISARTRQISASGRASQT